jgi:TIR domain/Restriction endonuclease
MAADPLIYCLEQLTDYDQFERLSHDIMALNGYCNIEPLGGSKDKGRDAIHHDASTGTSTVFAYSVREDWRTKLAEDAAKVQRHGHACQRLVFLCTSIFTATERDEATSFIANTSDFQLELYGLERLAVMLRTTHKEIVAQHPQIFCPPFFPRAGGLSLSLALDHVLIDHIDSDTGIAHWLARRLTLAGYAVWCRGLAPLAGASVTDTVRELLNNRAFRYICILSPESVTQPDCSARRAIAHTVGSQRGTPIVVPALARPIDVDLLDQDTARLTFARFDEAWERGLRSIEDVLSSANCPRKPDGARELAIRSYFPPSIVVAEPEPIASNLFPVRTIPEVIHRFQSNKPIQDDSESAGHWGFRKVSDTELLSFHRPPTNVAREFGITDFGGAVWSSTVEIDGIKTEDLVKELLKKALYAECRRRGLRYCKERRVVYFPTELLKNDHLRLTYLDGSSTFFVVTGERTHGRSGVGKKYRYHIAPVFVPKGEPRTGYEIILRIRVRITDVDGKLYSGSATNARRKKLCKDWWNQEWLKRLLGVMQFLAGQSNLITIGNLESERIVIDPIPRTWQAPVRLNEEALGDTEPCEEEAIQRENEEEADEEADAADDEEDKDDDPPAG